MSTFDYAKISLLDNTFPMNLPSIGQASLNSYNSRWVLSRDSTEGVYDNTPIGQIFQIPQGIFTINLSCEFYVDTITTADISQIEFQWTLRSSTEGIYFSPLTVRLVDGIYTGSFSYTISYSNYLTDNGLFILVNASGIFSNLNIVVKNLIFEITQTT
jgi:hypothetical protein